MNKDMEQYPHYLHLNTSYIFGLVLLCHIQVSQTAFGMAPQLDDKLSICYDYCPFYLILSSKVSTLLDSQNACLTELCTKHLFKVFSLEQIPWEFYPYSSFPTGIKLYIKCITFICVACT